MKIQLMSDLHLEFDSARQPGGCSVCNFVESLDPSGVQVLVLAGDICNMQMLTHVAERFTQLYPHVVFVAGNHEYYGHNVSEVEAKLETVDKDFENFHVLNPGKVVIGGVTFVGSTMWFEKPDPISLQHGRWAMGDFRAIKDIEPWVFEKNKSDQNFIVDYIDEADVVITHHLPSYKCVSSRYKGSALNPFFVCEMDSLIYSRKPPLWFHGHTHNGVYINIGETQVVCNPRGYPGEGANTVFDRKLVLEVQSQAE